ncbi:MAG TPA: homoserine kinase [Chloroflexota bacterium]|nr:homoserine kinase [Chloroflexota bacterium]
MTLRIEVPATCANLGPGFDTLGIAVDLSDIVRVNFDMSSHSVSLRSDSVELDSTNNLICRAYRSWADDTDAELPGACFTLESHIPHARGLGSSAASIVAGLVAAAHAAGEKHPRERILRLATAVEGHPDNIAPAVLGGLTTAFRDGDHVRALHVASYLDLRAVLYVPEDRLDTESARRAIPSTVPLEDAVYDLGRLAYLTTALIWGRWNLIAPAMRDRLHQPYRARLVPALDDLMEAALAAGAYGACLSGGGPSVLALAPTDRAADIAAAFLSAAATLSWPGSILDLAVRESGYVIKEEKDSDGVP